jgi:hypothetical protein
VRNDVMTGIERVEQAKVVRDQWLVETEASLRDALERRNDQIHVIQRHPRSG